MTYDRNADGSSYQGILFDLDNTLVDRAAAVVGIAHALYDAEPAIRAQATRDEAVAKLVALDDDGAAGRHVLMERVLAQWPRIGRRHEELVAWYGARYVALYEEDSRMQALVAALRRAGTPWGIVTNGNSHQHDKAPLLGPEANPGCFIVSAEIGHTKPAPEIFHEALRQTGLTASRRVLFVGDNPVADIGGAQAVGMSTAWVRRGRAWPTALQPPDHQVDHVAELAPMLGLAL